MKYFSLKKKGGRYSTKEFYCFLFIIEDTNPNTVATSSVFITIQLNKFNVHVQDTTLSKTLYQIINSVKMIKKDN